MEKRLTKEEFLKDLWHTASEKPNIKQGECCVWLSLKMKVRNYVYISVIQKDVMSPKDFKRNFKGWLYIDDLFLKEGDKQ